MPTLPHLVGHPSLQLMFQVIETAELARYLCFVAAVPAHIFNFPALCGRKVFALVLCRTMMLLPHVIISGNVISAVTFYQSLLHGAIFIVARSFYNDVS